MIDLRFDQMTAELMSDCIHLLGAYADEGSRNG